MCSFIMLLFVAAYQVYCGAIANRPATNLRGRNSVGLEEAILEPLFNDYTIFMLMKVGKLSSFLTSKPYYVVRTK